MAPARTPKRNGQIAFALSDVMRNEIGQKGLDAAKEFTRLRKRPDVACHFRVLPRKLTQSRNKVRVGQKTHIENQVGIGRQSIAIAEAHHRNHQWPLAPALKAIRDELAQLMNIKLRRVDDYIREFSDRRH